MLKIPKHARLNDVLDLKVTIEHARDDLTRAQRHLAEAQKLERASELAVGTALACMETVVAIYNRLVVEWEPEEKRRR